MRISDLNSGGNGQLPGMYITQENAGVQVYSLSWDRPTVIKILPAVEGGAIQPCWRNPEEVSDWIRTLPKYVRAAGTLKKISFDCTLSASDSQIYTESPYERMRRLFDQRAKMPGNAELKVMLFEGSQTRGPVMPKPSMFATVQCTMLYHDGKDFTSRPKMNVLQVISRTGTQSLTRLLQQQDATGKPLLGDAMDPTNRTMFLFQRKDVAPMVPLGWTLGTSGELSTSSSDGREFKAHVCYAVTPPANVLLPGVEHVKQAWKSWDKILRKLSADEQLNFLCSAFDVWILKDAFMGSEFESRLPDFIKNAKVGMPVQQPQYQPQQGGYQPLGPNGQAGQWQQPPQQPQYPQQQGWAPQQPMMQPQQMQQPQYQPQQGNWAPQPPMQPQQPVMAPVQSQPFGNPFDMGMEEQQPPQQTQVVSAPQNGNGTSFPQYQNPQQIQPPQQTQAVNIPNGNVNQERLNANIAALNNLVNRRPPG